MIIIISVSPARTTSRSVGTRLPNTYYITPYRDGSRADNCILTRVVRCHQGKAVEFLRIRRAEFQVSQIQCGGMMTTNVQPRECSDDVSDSSGLRTCAVCVTNVVQLQRSQDIHVPEQARILRSLMTQQYLVHQMQIISKIVQAKSHRIENSTDT